MTNRFEGDFSCPVCDGNKDLPQHQGRRCGGFLSGDGKAARCTREEHAGGLPLDTKTQPPTYVHWLAGPCKCGVDHRDAAAIMKSAPTQPSRSDVWNPIVPVPDSVGLPEERVFQWKQRDGYKLACAPWAYLDAQGRVLCFRARFERPDGSKDVIPFTFCEGPGGERRWRAKDLPSGSRPVYNQQFLATRPDAPVFGVEGEKAADAATDLLLDHVAVTSVAGAGGVRHVDWRPLAGRRITWWPDADAAGRTYAEEAATRALKSGALEARIVELPEGLPEGWDLADLHDSAKTPDWMTAEIVRELIDAAPVFEIPPSDGPPRPTRSRQASLREKNAPENVAADIVAGDLQDCFLFHHGTDRWYAYDAARGIWAPEQKSVVHAAVDRTIEALGLAPAGYGERYVGSTMGLLRGRLSVADFSKRIGFTNGVLVDGELRPHAPTNYVLNALPYPYDPAATCEPVKQWLRWAVREEDGDDGDRDVVHVLRCFLHAIVNGRADFQVFLEILGPGGTGKGTFMRLAAALVGEHASMATELKQLEASRFETATLKDKLLIQVNDSDRYGGEVSVLKKLTGGDAIRFEEKMKQPGQAFRASGMVVITCNEPIRSSDYTSGLARRRITVKFDRQVEMADARDLEAEFTPYLSGVYNWVNALDGEDVARELRAATTSVEALAALREEVEQASNPLAAWALEKLCYLPDARTKIGAAHRIPARAGSSRRGEWGDDEPQRSFFLDAENHLYPSYRDWCEGAGVQGMSLQRFADNLVDLLANQYKLPRVFKKRMPEGVCIFGVVLSAEPGPLGTPVTVPEARDGQRQRMKTMKTPPQVFIPSNAPPEPLNEDHEDHEDFEKSVHARSAHVSRARKNGHEPGNFLKPSFAAWSSSGGTTTEFDGNEDPGGGLHRRPPTNPKVVEL